MIIWNSLKLFPNIHGYLFILLFAPCNMFSLVCDWSINLTNFFNHFFVKVDMLSLVNILYIFVYYKHIYNQL